MELLPVTNVTKKKWCARLNFRSPTLHVLLTENQVKKEDVRSQSIPTGVWGWIPFRVPRFCLIDLDLSRTPGIRRHESLAPGGKLHCRRGTRLIVRNTCHHKKLWYLVGILISSSYIYIVQRLSSRVHVDECVLWCHRVRESPMRSFRREAFPALGQATHKTLHDLLGVLWP